MEYESKINSYIVILSSSENCIQCITKNNVPVFLLGFFKTPRQGCQTTVLLACSSEVEGVTGKYFMDCAERKLSPNATDEAKAKKLWELSEKIVNLKTTDPKI